MISPNRHILIAIVVLASVLLVYSLIFISFSSNDIVVQFEDERNQDYLEEPQEEKDDLFDWYKKSKEYKNFTRLSVLDSHQSHSNVADDLYTEEHLLDFITSPSTNGPYNFRKCKMSNCFDFSNCRNNGPLKVHIVSKTKTTQDTYNTSGESNHIHKNILRIIKESVHYEPDEKKACIFVLEDDTLDRDPLSQSFRANLANIFGPNNNYGMNYLIFNLYSGSWPDYRENDYAGLNFGAAMIAKASNSIFHHRSGFDLSLPLFSYLHPYSNSDRKLEKFEGIDDENRTYFLTFKGKRYVYGSGSETRNNLYHLNNQRDVIMLTTCRHGKKWRDSNDGRCSNDESNYDQYDFVDLMKESTFCLTPRGRRLGSFRFLEALSFGCIPVILSDGWVEPFDELIDWSTATVQFSENMLLHVPDMLRDIDARMITSMRKNCRELYEQYFSTIEKIILTTLEIIERRIKDRVDHWS